MKCPRCGLSRLFKDVDGNIICRFCNYRLTEGEKVNYRLFELLRDDSRQRFGR